MWEAPSHWVVVALIAIALFGYKKLPDAARSLGRSLRIFKTEIKGMSEDDKARASADAAADKPAAVESAPEQAPGQMTAQTTARTSDPTADQTETSAAPTPVKVDKPAAGGQ